MSTPAIAGGTPVRTRPFPAWPEFDRREVDAVRQVIESRNWGGYSPAVTELERRFAERHAVPHAVACCNGTVALHAALLAAGIGPGDEVIVPPITFVATATAPALAGGIPVFADIDPHTQNLDPRAFEAAITPRTKAVIAVHFAGQPADMDRICEIAARRGIAVIEDAAHAHGAAWRGRPVGGFGLVSTFSFQAFKLMTAGEGGMVLSRDPEIAARVRSVCNQGRVAGGQWYEHVNLGTNYRLTGLQAAILLVQMERLQDHNERRAANVARLRAGLGPGLEPLTRDARVTIETNYLVVLRYRPEAFHGLPREAFLAAVKAEGIPISPGYPYPLYRNPLFTEGTLHTPGIDYSRLNLPAAEQACRESVWLEHQLFLEDGVADIVEAIEKVRAGADQIRALWEQRGAHA